MPEQVCADASLVLMLLLPHDLTPQVEDLWRGWIEADVEIVAPPMFFAEVASVLRESVYFGRILAEEGEDAFSAFMSLGVRAMDAPDLQPRAWTMAKQHNRPRAYDAQYLAVAATLGCELWTGDRRLVNAVDVPWLKWVGDDEARQK